MRIFIVFFLANLIIIGIYAKKDCKVKLLRCESKKPPLRRQVCGTDNQTYPNRCALLRVQCAQNSPLTVKHTGKCREKQPCWMDQNKKMTKNSEKSSGNSADYIPECLADGTYAPVQCHMGYCWCVTSNGRMILGTSVRHRRLDCPKRGKANSSNNNSMDNEYNAKTGCDETNRNSFIKNLVRIFKTEYNRRDTRGIHYDKLENRNNTSLDFKAVEWKFMSLDTDRNNSLNKNEYKDLRALVRKVVKPKKCSRKFIRMCDLDRNMVITKQEWINCFNDTSIEEDEKSSHEDFPEETDSDSEDVDMAEPERDPAEGILSQGPLPLYEHPAESEKEPENKVNDCFADRKSVLDEVKLGNQLTYLPECNDDGRYKKVQCFPSTGYCWCVMEDSGKPIPGTSVKNDTPKCEGIQNLPPSIADCPDHKRILFVRNLIDFFHHNLNNTKIENEDVGVEVGKDGHEQTAIRGFYSLDSNKNKVLDKKEWKLFRTMVSTMNNKTLKKCGRKFMRHCDSNQDNKVNLNEWLRCLSVQNINIHDVGSSSENKKQIRRGPNPIESLLEADD